MTSDALMSLGLRREQIEGILEAVGRVDSRHRHLKHSCHRVRKWQDNFERFRGNVCRWEGAEIHAAKFMARAQAAWAEGEDEAAQEAFGYCVHFIQDGLCPEHILPFSERFVHFWSIAHVNIEGYMHIVYRCKDWGKSIREAKPASITSPEDLRRQIEEATDWVANLPCSYIRNDRIRMTDARVGRASLSGWRMSDADMGRWMARAASIVKGVAILAAHKEWQIRDSSRKSPQ